MLPLYYALMKYYTTVDDACVEDAMEALKGTYSNFKQFKKKALTEALMTAKSNGLLDESRVEMDANNERPNTPGRCFLHPIPPYAHQGETDRKRREGSALRFPHRKRGVSCDLNKL